MKRFFWARACHTTTQETEGSTKASPLQLLKSVQRVGQGDSTLQQGYPSEAGVWMETAIRKKIEGNQSEYMSDFKKL